MGIRGARITMMQAAEIRLGDDLPLLRRADRPGNRGVAIQRKRKKGQDYFIFLLRKQLAEFFASHAYAKT